MNYIYLYTHLTNRETEVGKIKCHAVNSPNKVAEKDLTQDLDKSCSTPPFCVIMRYIKLKLQN